MGKVKTKFELRISNIKKIFTSSKKTVSFSCRRIRSLLSLYSNEDLNSVLQTSPGLSTTQALVHGLVSAQRST